MARASVGFTVVDPSEVPAGGAGRGELSPASKALLEGATIWIEGKNRASRFAQMAKPRGYRVRTRSGARGKQQGTYVWLEPIEAPAEA